MKVAIYLRVSTLDQATKNNQREGYSIPAQREACRRKAKELGATRIREYADRGESARSASRPELQRLLHDLCDKKQNIQCVIVHKIDRLARNLHDDVMIGLAIKKAGATLVSVTENIDETPSGRLLHGIMATIAEFYSRNLAAEAFKGATEKAKRGGTPFQAPIGYVNVTERVNRREVHTIALDQSRAPLIRWAFECYATGDYSELELLDQLSKRGLRTRLRSRSKVEPISHGGLNKLLQNRYYLGYVTYCGVEYKGNHQPLVTPAVFAAGQAIRESRYCLSRKNRSHNHYLSRLLLCSRCNRHLCYMVSKHRYEYYSCLNRKNQQCNQPYIPAQKIEQGVINQLKLLKLSVSDRQKLSEQIENELGSERTYAETDIKTQTQRVVRLQAEKENLLQTYYDKVISADLFKSEQKRIDKEIRQAQGVIAEATRRLKFIDGRQVRALKMVKELDFSKAYINADPAIRRHFCKALFDKLAVDDGVIIQRNAYRYPREHHVTITKVMWQNPINIRHLTNAILAIALKKHRSK